MALAGRAVVIDPAKHPLSSTPPPPTSTILSIKKQCNSRNSKAHFQIYSICATRRGNLNMYGNRFKFRMHHLSPKEERMEVYVIQRV